MKLIKQKPILLVSILSLGFLSLFFIYKNPKINTLNNQIINNPIILTIDSIGVFAKIESLGLTDTGAVESPSASEKVSWFNLGPAPGEPGNSIISGHSGWKNNQPAAFDDLDKLKIGDKIQVENKDGTKVLFIVSKIKIYKPEDDPSLVFGIGDGNSHLNLITCSGLWDDRQKKSPDRLVIFSNREIL